VPICVRTVGNLLDRSDEPVTLSSTDPERLRNATATAGRVILAIDGMQPDVGHEVLWIVRDVLSGEVLLARSLLSPTQGDLAALLCEVSDILEVPIVGVVSDGQTSIRKAVARALPGVPHQLCQFHDLREAARPVYEADRHLGQELRVESLGSPAALPGTGRRTGSAPENAGRNGPGVRSFPQGDPNLLARPLPV
jgi:hypothetical protein